MTAPASTPVSDDTRHAIPPPPRVGCAGWSLPRAAWPSFPGEGSHLERYAGVLNAVEINSSFYRPHQAKTYERWAGSVPDDFRFSVKVPKQITHERRLAGCDTALDEFMAQAGGLGGKLGCLLVQLPPSLRFDAHVAGAFLDALRHRHAGALAVEPRHASWFDDPRADALLRTHRAARALADPALHAAGRDPGGWPALVYLRLHGSPRIYYSDYPEAQLAALAARIGQARAQAQAEVWCIFDNTAAGAAVDNALALGRHLGERA